MERPLALRQTLVLLSFTLLFISQVSGVNVLARQGPSPPTQLPGTWSYKGCYVDSVNSRSLGGASSSSATQNASTCIAFCDARGYSVAGTEYGDECYCGSSISDSNAATDGCSMSCAGTATEACGGPNRLSVYERPASTSNSSNLVLVGTTGNWSRIGCYSDSTGARLLAVGMAVQGGPSNMSAESCITACDANKYKFAGTEYSSECYCGNTLDNKQTPQTDGCDMYCNGNQTQFCGGSNRVSLYGVNVTITTTSSSTSSKPTPTPTPSAVVSSSAAVVSSVVPSSAPVVSSAVPSSVVVISSIVPSSSAAPPPSSSAAPSIVSSSQVSSAQPSSTIAAVKKQGWYLEGCYTDGAGGRTLTVNTAVAGKMTNPGCTAYCKGAGYIYAGTEYAAECYCDNKIQATGGPAPDGNAGCNMACAGNATDICGGPNRLSLYKFYTGDETATSTPAVGGPSSIAASSLAASSSAVVPVASGLPKGFTYKGCYTDGPGFRIMNYQQNDDQTMTIASCANACYAAGYSIAGMEYSYQCFCDNYIRNGGSLSASDTDCSSPCAGNSAQTCGGPGKLSIYSNQTVLEVFKVPTPVQNVSSWEYQGCITDGGEGDRTLMWQVVNITGNSPEWCLSQCQAFGYMAAGMEYGQECYCGDLDTITSSGSTVAAESECNTPCPGKPDAICGAGNRLSWYKWTGDPLYVWQYPTGAAAGQYKFLVGGLIIPLISQPGINGKVTLLEKHGTGAGNSTGAFELDPSNNAFRELQGITTDIFCAAGLTMPDRAGRQINIGGWSLDSLFGVRIHTPDGAPGVVGTNGWQEDVSTVKLQNGRWYPTGLVMANGSMLIVGGQDGSGGAPVPTMEVLPTVGPVYFAQWLKDTDPYNLYPFLVVLPSGGIFIQYYNQARVLDAGSLNTLKILPQVPASVNDPSGGRTYPYEGTQVLMPQYYPYDAPLEILICGGAARQPRYGLDNCVSTTPDSGNPTWIIERLPSRRVMSCMATLPDGTYLILNGAHIGEAGFNLAEDPNLNALLYDSRKPRHQRISIMANTTVARLYHSEAVLMDDGRVLVTGSDPESPDFPQEYRYEVFIPPYLLSGPPQPSFTLTQIDWDWEAQYAFTVTSSSGAGIKVSLMGSESSTHGSSMGARILFPQVSCAGNACTVTAPKGPFIAPVGWYRMFVLDGPTPSHATWVRIGGDPGNLGNWPNAAAFQPLPGVGKVGGATANAKFAKNTTASTNGTVAGRLRF